MYEECASRLKPVQNVWHTAAIEDTSITLPANEYWGLSFIRHADGEFSAELGGPSLRPLTFHLKPGEEYWGIAFLPHVTINGINKCNTLSSFITLPTKRNQFFIDGARYSIPTYEALEDMAAKFVADKVIINSEPIQRSLAGDDEGFSERSWQRYFRNITGLTKQQIAQIARARRATLLLESGFKPLDVAIKTGYADQAHMSRALKRFTNETPAEIAKRQAT